jgi:hypothetical protein
MFEVGGTVRVVNTARMPFSLGEEFYVTGVHNQNLTPTPTLLSLEGRTGLYMAHRFEVVPPPAEPEE